MNGRRFRGAAVVGVVLLSAIATVVAYNVGFSHGLAQQLVAQGGQVPAYPYWYRPWGFGFGFPILFFILFWFVLARALFWGRRWHHGYGSYPAGWRGVPPAFEEWHRQAHERLKEQKPADDPGRRG